MQVTDFMNAVAPGAHYSDSTKKPTQTVSFDLMLRAALTPPVLTPEEEMQNFKMEVYTELATINSMYSSSVLSHSIHITDDGFRRMKEDPAYRKEIMDWLREDTIASRGLPYCTHATTIINGVTATSYSVSDDRYQKDPAARAFIQQKAADCFYYLKRDQRIYAERRAAERRINLDYALDRSQQRESMLNMILEKHFESKTPLPVNLAQSFHDQNLQSYLLSMQLRKNWGI